MTVVQGDDTVLIADTAGGKVWATTLEDFASFNTASPHRWPRTCNSRA